MTRGFLSRFAAGYLCGLFQCGYCVSLAPEERDNGGEWWEF